MIMQQIFPTLQAILARKVISKKINSESSLISLNNIHIRDEIKAEVLCNDLEKIHYAELSRRDRIESKAGSIFSINAIIIPLLLITYDIAQKSSSQDYKNGIIIILLIASVYMCLSVINAIIAQRISQVHQLLISDYEDNTLNTLHSLQWICNDQKIAIYYRAIKLNILSTQIKANHTYASQIDLRNGIILSFIALTSLILL